MDEVLKALDKLDKKLDILDTKFDKHQLDSVRHRTEQKRDSVRLSHVEEDLEPIKAHVQRMNGAAKLIVVLALVSTIGGFVALFIKG